MVVEWQKKYQKKTKDLPAGNTPTATATTNLPFPNTFSSKKTIFYDLEL
jgi:hypothetical protein